MKVSSNGLNVREQPDTNSGKKTVLENGEKFAIKEEKIDGVKLL